MDAGNAVVTATLSVTEGTLIVAPGGSGATVAGSGTAAVTITGTLAQINALLGTNTGTVAYLNSSDTPPASAILTLAVNDQGNTGGGAQTDSDTAVINIAAVNDAPTAAIAPASYAATEQVLLSLKKTGLSVADVDAGNAVVTATLSVSAGTLIVAPGASGATVAGSGTAAVTITGTLAQINALLQTNTGTVAYLNSSDTPPASAILTLAVNDQGNTGGGAQTDSDTAVINIAAVNDAPVAAIAPASYAATEQVPLSLKKTGLSVADVDAGNAVVKATLSVSAGTLIVAPGASGATVAGSGTAAVTITGTVAQINALLGTNTGTLAYLNSSDTPPASAILTLAVNDQGNTGGGAQTDSDTAVINIAAVNDAPTAAIAPASYAATEQVPLSLKKTGLSVADVDAGNSVVTATLSVTAGTLTVAPGASGATVQNSGTAAVTITGTLAQINALFGTNTGTVAYLNSSDTPPASAILTLAVNDQGNAGSGGAKLGSDTAVINIAAVNDAPTAAIAPASYAATEQVLLSLKKTGLSVADLDAGTNLVTATLSVTEGTLIVAAGGSGTTVAGSGTSAVTITGTLAQINALLQTNTGTVAYLNSSDTASESAILALSVNDQGHTGGGAQTGSDTAVINIHDAPVVITNGSGDLFGQDGDDDITGDGGVNRIRGLEGDDRLDGAGGNDQLWGDAGNDSMFGGSGNDDLVGDAGDDTLRLGADNDRGWGGIGNDSIFGEGGDDMLQGEDGNDLLDGGDGNDTVYFDAGTDTGWGGVDNDDFVFIRGLAAGDTVQDFSGNGAAAGDRFVFQGYGTLAQGATFTQVDATHWRIHSADGLVNEVITLGNAATVDPLDLFSSRAPAGRRNGTISALKPRFGAQ